MYRTMYLPNKLNRSLGLGFKTPNPLIYEINRTGFNLHENTNKISELMSVNHKVMPVSF